MKSEKGFSVHVKKEFPVSVESLYKAWVTPEALKEWWQPMGKTLKEVKNEVKEGGKFRYRFEDSESPLEITGEYKRVNPKKQLVYTWDFNFEKESLDKSIFQLEINFSSDGVGSEISIAQENLKDKESVIVHEEGWNKQLDSLHSYLVKGPNY